MIDDFSYSSRRALTRASALARRAALGEVGTDALLLALADGSDVSGVLARYGATDLAIRDVVACWWGWLAPPDDEQLLASLGIDVDRLRVLLPAGFDETAGYRLVRSRLRPLRLCLVGPAGAQALSGQARKAVEVALWRAGRRGASHVGDSDLLAGMIADSRSRAAQVLRELGVCFRTLTEHLEALDAPDAAA